MLGAGRGVQAGEVETPAMAAERQRREERRGGEQRAMRRATEATGQKTASAYGYATHTKSRKALSFAPPLPNYQEFFFNPAQYINEYKR